MSASPMATVGVAGRLPSPRPHMANADLGDRHAVPNQRERIGG